MPAPAVPAVPVVGPRSERVRQALTSWARRARTRHELLEGASPEPWRRPPADIVTPHNGATTARTVERGDLIVLDNLRRFVAGRPLVNVVDKESGY